MEEEKEKKKNKVEEEEEVEEEEKEEKKRRRGVSTNFFIFLFGIKLRLFIQRNLQNSNPPKRQIVLMHNLEFPMK